MLMSNSFLGLKAVDSRVMQVESRMDLVGAARDILNDPGSPQVFADAVDSESFTTSDLFTDVTTTVEVKGNDDGELTCKRRMQASGTNNNFKCKYMQVNLNHAYGRETANGGKRAVNTLGIGIEQPILAD